MTLKISIVFYCVEVASRFGFVLRRVPTDGAAEIKKIRLCSFELFQTRGDQVHIF